MKPNPSFSPIIRACLITAIIGGSISTVNVLKLRGKLLRLQNAVMAETAARESVERELLRTERALTKSVADLGEAKAALEKCSSQRDRALTEATRNASHVEQLSRSIKDTRLERDETKAELARYTNTGMTAQQVARVAGTIKQLRDSIGSANAENLMLRKNVRQLTAEADTQSVVTLPADLTSRINLSDPKWGFIIIDAGSNKGMLQRAELLISRNGKLVGKVKVRRVEKDRSFADLLPGWNFGELVEGDLAIPAHPET